MVWHATFCINSLAHWVGEQEYSLDTTARGGLLLAVLTQGEGHHNYHHAFPKDYRNGVRWFDYDPTKWAVTALATLGLASNLHTTPKSEIEKGKIQVLEHKTSERRKNEFWGLADSDLVVYESLDQVKKECSEGRQLLVIDNLVVDVAGWKDQHPGGSKHITNNIGRNATSSFYGLLNNHTSSAKTLVRTMAVGKIVYTNVDVTAKEE
ncbi:hypothetical protein SeMB42_g03367 [Synchytrium endobioticum]|nr:hypothetical protein SeMB42_g03367 [Synchytrium endobioticum]